jgi:hypothetical protein
LGSGESAPDPSEVFEVTGQTSEGTGLRVLNLTGGELSSGFSKGGERGVIGEVIVIRYTYIQKYKKETVE